MGRRRITRTFEGIAPAVLIHGHYHVTDEARVNHIMGLGPGHDGGCLVVSLDQQDTPGNVCALDLTALTTSPLAISSP